MYPMTIVNVLCECSRGIRPHKSCTLMVTKGLIVYRIVFAPAFFTTVGFLHSLVVQKSVGTQLCTSEVVFTFLLEGKSRTSTVNKKVRSAWTEAATDTFFEGLYRVS